MCEARQQNAEAWRTLYERYLPTVWRYAYALIGDVHAAEDVVGEVMLALLKGIGQIDIENPRISAWLRSVVRHKVADHHRSSIRTKDRIKSLAANSSSESNVDGNSLCPLELAEARDQVLAILDGLTERQRMALEWKYVEDLRVREIAERWGETEKAVEATLYRARREFRRRFDLVERSARPDVPSQAASGQETRVDLRPK